MKIYFLRTSYTQIKLKTHCQVICLLVFLFSIENYGWKKASLLLMLLFHPFLTLAVSSILWNSLTNQSININHWSKQMKFQCTCKNISIFNIYISALVVMNLRSLKCLCTPKYLNNSNTNYLNKTMQYMTTKWTK